MSFLVRKINKAKWPKENFSEFDIRNLRADALTSCLRTSKDTLSTWEIQSMEDLSEAILALVSTFERLDKIDVVIIERNEISNSGFEIEDTPGDTPIDELKNTHKDIVGLTYKTMGEFSQLLLDTMGVEGRMERYTVKKVEKLLKSAIDSGILDLNSLKESLRKSLTAS
ncbi:hypothetical protein [Peribacillus simplex]|uniref:hypothetical protein n=1 Tax=Peribacillus simplex TaxID=1478 RepID=UPI0036DF288F